MPFLRLELDAMPKIVPCAKAAHVEPGTILWGLAQAWEWCWREKETAVTDMQLEGFFGGNIAPALRAFGFLKEPQNGRHPIAGAEKYLRITQGRKAGGEASKGNLVPRQSQANPNEVSRKTQDDPKAIPRPNDLGFIGSTASSEQRSASSEQQNTPPLPLPGGSADDSSGTESIRDVIEQVHREVRQSDYQWKGHPGAGDDSLTRDILHLAKSNPDEVRRVWRKALGTTYPMCLDLATLKRHWSVYAGVEPPRATADPRKAPVRAEDIPKDSFANPGRVVDF